MGVDEVRQQLSELRVSVDALTDSVGFVKSEIEDVRKEQSRSAESHKQLHAETRVLHEEHLSLVDKLRAQEQGLAVHLRDYERQQETNSLIHAHMSGTTIALREELQEFRGEFKEHARIDEEDRKDQLAAQIATNDSLRTTFLSVLISAGGLFLALLGILVTLWIHASGLIG